MKIATKFVLIILIIALMVLSLGFYSARITRHAFREIIAQKSTNLAKGLLRDIDHLIEMRFEELQIHLSSISFKNAMMEANNEFNLMDDAEREIQARERRWVSSSVDHSLKEKLLQTPESEELKKVVEDYQQKYGYPVFGEIFLTNRYGTLIAFSGETSDYYQADESWWQEAKKQGFSIEDIHYDESSGIYGLAISVALFDEGENFIGVVKSILNFEEIAFALREAEQLSSSQSTVLKLLTRNDKLIYSTEDFRFLEDYSAGLNQLSSLWSENGSGDFLIVEDESLNNVRLIVRAQPENSEIADQLGWTLIVEYDAQEVFASLNKLEKHLFMATLMIMVVAVFLGLLISQSVSRPLLTLNKAAEEFGQGRFDCPVCVKAGGEVRLLADTFNTMTQRIKESAISLERLNQEIKSRKKAENDLKNLNQDLQINEAALKNMLYDLNRAHNELKEVQNQLLQSEKMAAVGHLSAGVAHEIKNPLSVILLSAESLEAKTRKMDPSLVKRVSMIKESAQRANRVIVDLLNFSRFSNMQMQPVRLSQPLSKAIEFSLQAAKLKGIEIKSKEADPGLSVEGDQVLLQHIFLNIITNAIDVLDKNGKIWVNVEKAGDSDKNDQVYIRIKDSGPGIPKGIVNQIFEPFFTTKEQGKGTGLGLSIVYMLVEKHKGAITVESEEGQGTEFIISLPLIKNKEEDED